MTRAQHVHFDAVPLFSIPKSSLFHKSFPVHFPGRFAKSISIFSRAIAAQEASSPHVAPGRTNTRGDLRKEIWKLVTHLADERHRILVTGQDNQTVEIIHDVLLRTWGRLQDWIRDDRTFLEWRQEIEKPAQVWKGQPHDKKKPLWKGRRDKNEVLRGRDLQEAKKWLKERRTDLNQNEIASIRASAQYSVNLMVRLLIMIFLIVSLTGAAGWYHLHQAADPARLTNLNDDGPGSLRYCVNNIQSYPTLSHTITFAPGLKGTIHLTSGTLSIKGSMTIDGPGANVLAVSSGNTNSDIAIQFGASVTISGLSFQDSSFNGRSFLNNNGTLTLVNSTLSNNHTGSTGGGSQIITGSGGAYE